MSRRKRVAISERTHCWIQTVTEIPILARATFFRFQPLQAFEFSRTSKLDRVTRDEKKVEKKNGARLLLSNPRHCINIYSRQKRNKARNPSRHCYAAGAARHSFFTPGRYTRVLRARREFSWELRLQR